MFCSWAELAGTAWPGHVGNCLRFSPLVDDLPDSETIDVQLFGDLFKSLPRLKGIYITFFQKISESYFDLGMVILCTSTTKCNLN